MRNLFIIAVVLVLSVTTLSLSSAEAKDSYRLQDGLQIAQNKAVISKGQAIAAVKNQMAGKVLSANLIKSQGPPVYRVKLLLEKGRVRTVFVDATNGRVIRIR